MKSGGGFKHLPGQFRRHLQRELQLLRLEQQFLLVRSEAVKIHLPLSWRRELFCSRFPSNHRVPCYHGFASELGPLVQWKEALPEQRLEFVISIVDRKSCRKPNKRFKVSDFMWFFDQVFWPERRRSNLTSWNEKIWIGVYIRWKFGLTYQEAMRLQWRSLGPELAPPKIGAAGPRRVVLRHSLVWDLAAVPEVQRWSSAWRWPKQTLRWSAERSFAEVGYHSEMCSFSSKKSSFASP